MAITHFKILKLPNSNKVTSTINGVALLENILYPISEQSNLLFERVLDLEGIFLEEKLEYILIDENNDIKSNSAYIELIWKSNNNLIPTSSNQTISINNSETITLIDHIFFNVVTEFIEIIDLSDNFLLLKNGNKVSIGEIISVSDLLFTNFTSLSEGGGDPYFKISYKAGNKKETNQTTYNLQININSLAELKEEYPVNEINYNDEFDVNGILTTYNVIEQTYYCVVDKGYINSNAEIQIIINSPFLSLNQWNKVIIETTDDFIEKTVNETFNLILKLNEKGRTVFKVTNYIVEDTSVYANSNINVTLLNINNDISLVSNINILSLVRTPPAFARYPLTSNANEAIGTIAGIDGVATNVVFDGTKAIFNGTDSHIIIPDNDAFSFTDGNGNDLPFTIEFKASLNTIKPTFFLSKRVSSREWQIFYNNNIFYVYLFLDTSNYLKLEHPIVFNQNQEYNFKTTYNGSKNENGIRFFLDNVEMNSTKTMTGNYTGMVNTNDDIYIGKFSSNNIYELDGYIKDLKFYNFEKLN